MDVRSLLIQNANLWKRKLLSAMADAASRAADERLLACFKCGEVADTQCTCDESRFAVPESAQEDPGTPRAREETPARPPSPAVFSRPPPQGTKTVHRQLVGRAQEDETGLPVISWREPRAQKMIPQPFSSIDDTPTTHKDMQQMFGSISDLFSNVNQRLEAVQKAQRDLSSRLARCEQRLQP